MSPLNFRPIEHDMCDHTWSDVESVATQCHGQVAIVVRKYLNRNEWSGKIIGLGCERFRIAWEARSGDIENLKSGLWVHLRMLYPAHAGVNVINY